MGFFKAIGRGFGKLVEKTGSFFGSETIERAGRRIQDACSEVSKSTGNSISYDKDSSGVSETEKINKILSDFSLSLEKKADEIEEIAIKESNVYFNELINCLNESAVKTGININSIKREMRNSEKSIKGNLKKHISKRVSLDDLKCLEILKMEPGKQKENKMRLFSKSILKEGVDKLVKDIREIIEEEQSMINEVIHDRLTDIKFDLSKKLETFDELENDANNNENEQNEIIDKAKNKILLSETVIKTLN